VAHDHPLGLLDQPPMLQGGLQLADRHQPGRISLEQLFGRDDNLLEGGSQARFERTSAGHCTHQPTDIDRAGGPPD